MEVGPSLKPMIGNKQELYEICVYGREKKKERKREIS